MPHASLLLHVLPAGGSCPVNSSTLSVGDLQAYIQSICLTCISTDLGTLTSTLECLRRHILNKMMQLVPSLQSAYSDAIGIVTGYIRIEASALYVTVGSLPACLSTLNSNALLLWGVPPDVDTPTTQPGCP